MFFVVKNHFVLMQLGRQRADGAMMDVQDKASPTANTRLQPRVGEMAPIGMHVIPHQRGVLETEENYIGTAIGVRRMALGPSTFFHQRMANRPLPREKRWITHFKKGERNYSITESYTSFFQFPVLLFQATPMASFLDVEILISSPDKIFTFLITALNIRNRKQAEINHTQ